MDAKNSFKLLGKEEEEKFPHPPPDIEKGVMGNVKVFHFMSDVLELYIPKFFEVFIVVLGGGQEKDQEPDPPAGNVRNADEISQKEL